MTNFQKKAITSFSWSFFENIGNQGIQFIISVFLARLLIPEDFGLVGALSIFIGIAGVLVDGGFKISIIRSKDCTETDFSTIFYINLIVSLLVSALFFFLAPFLSTYFNKPELCNIAKAFSILPIINGLGLVQSAILFKNLKFKNNAKISFAANIISSLIALYLAYNNYSYWALVWRSIITAFFYTLFLWITSIWRPKLVFSLVVLRKHFKFSSKLLLTGVIDSIFDNIYTFLFGKFYNFRDLGFFSRGKAYAELVSNSVSTAIQKVNIPLILSESKNNESILNSYTKLLQASSLLIIGANVLMITIAETFVLITLGSKWLPSVPYLQILCIVGIIYNILNSNSSLLEILGRSDYILKTTLLSRPIQIIILVMTLQFSMKIIAIGIVFHYLFCLSLSFYFVTKTTNKKLSFFIKPIIKPIEISIITGTVILFLGYLIKNNMSNIGTLVILVVSSLIINIVLMRFYKLKEYQIIKYTISNLNLKRTFIRNK